MKKKVRSETDSRLVEGKLKKCVHVAKVSLEKYLTKKPTVYPHYPADYIIGYWIMGWYFNKMTILFDDSDKVLHQLVFISIFVVVEDNLFF